MHLYACCPSLSSIKVTEKGARVVLQDLFNHKCQGISLIQEVLIELEQSNTESFLVLTSKWGCDGASDQSKYKQKFEDGTLSDESIFMISFVPLTLKLVNSLNKKTM